MEGGVIPIVEDMARRVHVARRRTLALMKGYFLHMIEAGGNIPTISKPLIMEMFYSVTKLDRYDQGGSRSPTPSLQAYYTQVFSRITTAGVLNKITVDRYKLGQVLGYASTEVRNVGDLFIHV